MITDHVKYENQKKYWENIRKRRRPEHPVIKAFAEPKIEYVKKWIIIDGKKDGKKLSLLDVGCGNGFLTFYLGQHFDIVPLDFSVFMLKNHSYKNKICGSAMELPFEDDSFDIAFCSNLMHHLHDPVKAVLEMKRVSKKYVILSEPNRNNPLMFLFGVLNKAERGTLKFSLSYMKNLIRQTGLSLRSASNIGLILPNKTPDFLLPLLKKLDGEFPMAFYNILVSEKNEDSSY